MTERANLLGVFPRMQFWNIPMNEPQPIHVSCQVNSFRRKNSNTVVEISFLKAGIVTTVSRTYAREILTEDLGMGFQSILSKRRDNLTCIVNERWLGLSGTLQGTHTFRRTPITAPSAAAPPIVQSLNSVSGFRSWGRSCQ